MMTEGWTLLVNAHNWVDFKNSGRPGWRVYGEPKVFPCLCRISDCGIRALSAIFVYPEDVRKLNDVLYQGGDQMLALLGKAAPVAELLVDAKTTVEAWDDAAGGLPGSDRVLRTIRAVRRLLTEGANNRQSVVVDHERLAEAPKQLGGNIGGQEKETRRGAQGTQ